MRENAVKRHAGHGFSQFELSKRVLNNLYKYDLKPIAKLVLLYLCDCYNPEHGKMFPKQSTIAKKLGVSEVSVTRAIQELHKEGVIISERKYMNSYRLGARIVSEVSENEQNKMIDKTYQNEKQSIKMIAHEHEQIKEQNKTTNVEDFKILKSYAESKGAKNVSSYIAALKRNGSAEKIIKDVKAKKAADRYFAKQIEDTKKLILESESNAKMAVPPTEEWKNLKAKLLAIGK